MKSPQNYLIHKAPLGRTASSALWCLRVSKWPVMKPYSKLTGFQPAACSQIFKASRSSMGEVTSGESTVGSVPWENSEVIVSRQYESNPV